jgi:hypothetical protein
MSLIVSPLVRRLVLAAALSSLLPCLSGGTFVLCVGEDGHVAVEAGCEPAAAAGSGGERPTHAAECTCGDLCGPCVDQPVAVWSAGRAPAMREPIDPPAPLPCPAPTWRTEPLPGNLPHAGSLPDANGAGRPRSSIVLRI